MPIPTLFDVSYSSLVIGPSHDGFRDLVASTVPTRDEQRMNARHT